MTSSLKSSIIKKKTTTTQKLNWHAAAYAAHITVKLKLHINIAAIEPDKQRVCPGEIVEVSPLVHSYSPLPLAVPCWPFMLIIRFSCNPAKSHNLPYRKHLYSCKHGATIAHIVHSLYLMGYGISSHLCLAGVAHLHGYTDLCKSGQLSCSVCVWGDACSVESLA